VLQIASYSSFDKISSWKYKPNKLPSPGEFLNLARVELGSCSATRLRVSKFDLTALQRMVGPTARNRQAPILISAYKSSLNEMPESITKFALNYS
jgi:hypothetical protein